LQVAPVLWLDFQLENYSNYLGLAKFKREEMENSKKSKKLQNFEILPMTNGQF